MKESERERYSETKMSTERKREGLRIFLWQKGNERKTEKVRDRHKEET